MKIFLSVVWVILLALAFLFEEVHMLLVVCPFFISVALFIWKLFF